jgi:catechol-2,3-dioxygenase
MKRFHVHVAVDDVKSSVAFYSHLFAAAPSVEKPDYAKWMLEDPRVNFAISARGSKLGVEHLGIQVESDGELAVVYERLKHLDKPVLEEGKTNCCYAQSEKSWVNDPAGVPWEVFHTFGESTIYGGGPSIAPVQTETKPKAQAACCG